MHVMMLILVPYEPPGGKRSTPKSECLGVRCEVMIAGWDPAFSHDKRVPDDLPRSPTVRTAACCAKAGVRRIRVHDTRRTCGCPLAVLDVLPCAAGDVPAQQPSSCDDRR